MEIPAWYVSPNAVEVEQWWHEWHWGIREEQYRATLAARDQRIEELEAALAELSQDLLRRVDAEADQKLRDARLALEKARNASDNATYVEAQELLNEADAWCAARALTSVTALGENKDKDVERALRDVVITRCISRERPGDR